MKSVVSFLPLEGDPQQKLLAMFANHCATLFEAAGQHISFEVSSAELALKGDCTKAGLLAAALDAREVLASTPEGRHALGRLGFEAVAQEVEVERFAVSEASFDAQAERGSLNVARCLPLRGLTP